MVTVKRLAHTSNCSLTTDILVTSNSPEVVRHISQSRLNIGELWVTSWYRSFVKIKSAYL